MDGDATHDFLVNLCLAAGAGTLLVVLARRLKLPTIVLLLFGGIGLGPEGLGWIHPDAMGDALGPLVSLAVGIILFEGGLTLDLRGFGQASSVIRRLLSVGVLVTWLGTAAAVFAVFRHDLRFCVFVASLVIVTGPTVIVPLLRRIHIQPRLHGILHWEGVLIDAIGVFIAILCFEWIVAGEGWMAGLHFLIRVLAGLAIGAAGGFAIDAPLRWRWVPEALVNVFALAGAVLVFGLTEAVMPEAGLLAVTVAGFVVGWRHPIALKQIRQFKGELTDLLIGTLFVLLAGRLKMAQFAEFGYRGVWLLVLVLLVVRPLNVLVSTWGSPLSWRERLFLSWVAPRGIVAASMASLFALDLARRHSEFDGAFVETFVYSVIATSVVLQGFSAGIVARLLGLRKPENTGWMIVGAHKLGAEVGRFLALTTGHEVTIIDSNPRLVATAGSTGVTAMQGDALDSGLRESNERFQRVGHVLALTDNSELNELVCQRWSEQVERDGLHRVGTAAGARDAESNHRAGQLVWGKMPRPNLVSAEMRRGEASVLELVHSEENAIGDAQVLVVVRRDVVYVDPMGNGGSFALRNGDRLLVLRRAGGFLARGLAAGGMTDLQIDALESLHTQLVAWVTKLEPSIGAEALLEDLVAREKLMPTFLGHGLGVPHAFVPGLNRRLVFLVRLRPPLRVPEQGDPVSLIFLVISPPGDPEGHLATMADVARLCADAGNRSRLLAAHGIDDALAVVRAGVE